MWLLEKLIPAEWRWAATGIVVLVLLTAIGVQTVRLAGAQTDLANERADRAKVEAQRYAQLTDALQKLSDQQAAHAAEQQEAVHAYTEERTARRVAEARTTAADQRVRDTIRAYAAGGCSGAGTDAAAGGGVEDRTATLGLLLEDALGVAGALEKGAEQHAGEVRLLKRVIENDRAGCRPLNGASH